jgi:hypothetical protein
MPVLAIRQPTSRQALPKYLRRSKVSRKHRGSWPAGTPKRNEIRR